MKVLQVKKEIRGREILEFLSDDWTELPEF